MKQFMMLALSAAAVFAVVACSKNKPPVNPVVKEEPAAVAASPNADSLAKAKADSIEKARLESERLEAERLEAERARVENFLMN